MTNGATFLRNVWYVAMWAQDLAPSTLTHRTLLGENVVFFRTEDGLPVALEDRCPHRFAPLHLGVKLPDDRIRCGYHGLEFDVNGTCVYNPHGNQKIPPGAKVRAYPVVERHSILWIWMGDRPAQPECIPDFSVLDDAPAHLVSKRDVLRMEASYELITDNLLDLSHISFLHEGILGNRDTIAAETIVEQEGDTLEVTRLMRDVPAPALFDMMFRRDGGRVDLWNSIRWYPPGCMRNDAGVCPPGAAKSDGTGIFGTHFLTPETPATTFYHFAAVRQNPQNAAPCDEATSAEVQRKLSELRRLAFAEQDGPMIAGQQRAILDGGENLRPTLLSIDVGPVRCKRIMDSLIASERVERAMTQRAL